MERVWSSDIGRHVGERVQVAGWLHRLRRLSNVSFLILRDAKGLAQIVIEDPELAARLDAIERESVLAVEALVVAQPQAPGGVELHEPRIEVISAACAPPPFDLFRPTIAAQLPTMLDHAPVALRHPRQRAFFRLSAALMAGFRATLQGLDFVEIQTPKLVETATEGGANVFPRRLLRAAGVPGAEPAVLQADHGRGVRAGLRGGAGLSRRAARHAAPPQRVRLARCRDWGSSPTTRR